MTGWSVTLSERQGDVPGGLLDRMEAYSRLFSIASLFASEVDGRVRRMHVRGILRCKCMANEQDKGAVRPYESLRADPAQLRWLRRMQPIAAGA